MAPMCHARRNGSPCICYPQRLGRYHIRQKIRPDVIFCDIGLPGLNGYEVAKTLKADTELNGVFLIALTGYAGDFDIGRARAVGFGTAQTPRDIYFLKKEVDRLRIENSVLRKSGCPAVSPLSEKLEAIFRLRDEFSIHSLCKVLEVRRSTYYHRTLRCPEKTLVQQQDDVLNPLYLNLEKSRHNPLPRNKIR